MALKGVKVEGVPYHFDYNYLENIPQIDDELSQDSDNLVKNRVVYIAIQSLISQITTLQNQITNLTNRVEYLETYGGGGSSSDETNQVTNDKLSLSGSNVDVSNDKLTFTSGAVVSDNKLTI